MQRNPPESKKDSKAAPEETNETIERIKKFRFYMRGSRKLVFSILNELETSSHTVIPNFSMNLFCDQKSPLSTLCIGPVRSLDLERKQPDGKFEECKFPGFKVCFAGKSFTFYVVPVKNEQALMVETQKDIGLLVQFLKFCENYYPKAIDQLGWGNKPVLTFDMAFAEEPPIKRKSPSTSKV